MATLAYGPALLTARGVLPADTKLYLSLDPGRLLAAAPSLWDSSQFGGWVTHQTIGYLWPIGPWYWVLERLGAPGWVAQRLWIGSLLFAAGTGVWWCGRRLGLAHRGAYAAGLVYMVSPYVLPYLSRTSVLLSPWAGLGWLVGLTVLAGRRGGWRYPALFALVVATVGGINATALVLIAVAPLLWLVHAAIVTREISRRRALQTTARIGLLSVVVSLWWLVALAVQARYGADVLAYSETIDAVSSTSLASEVLRGLGYWLFYGGDVTGRWTGASTPYLQSPGLIALGFALAGAGLLGILLVRWRDRAFLAFLVAVGTVLGVGAYGVSPLANALQGASRSTLLLALRSSTRAVPVVLLGLTLGLAALITAWTPQLPRATVAAAAAVGLLAILNLPALWDGNLVDPVLRHPNNLPSWWHEAAASLDSTPPGYRVLELPGAEFAAHRWGITQDPILPGLTDRPTIARDLLPLGGAAAMDLLYALDDRFQNGVAEGPSIAPVARLLGADEILYRGDVAFDRYQGPRPQDVWALYQAEPPGLGAPSTFGPLQANVPSVTMDDEWALSSHRAGGSVPELALVPVDEPQPIVRTVDEGRAVMLAGSGAGVVDAAAAGLLVGDELLRYSADRTSPTDVAPGSLLIITDSNRKQARQWRGSQDTTGFTEDAGPGLLVQDDADQRLPVFGVDGGGVDEQTLAQQRGGIRATASAYGEPNSYRPEDRAFFAIDGDLGTAWTVGDGGAVGGSTLRLDLDEARDLTSVHLTQSLAPANRHITQVRLRTEAGERTANLGEASWTAAGEDVELPPGRSSWLEIEVVGDTVGRLATYAAQDAVGFAEVSVDGLVADEVVRVPTALLSDLGAASLDHPLAIVLTRERMDAMKRWRDDPETALVRSFTLPTERSFRLTGTARVSPRAPDAVLAGLAPTDATVAVASSRLAGVPAAGGPAAVDGDPSTAWQTAFGPAVGSTLSITTPTPRTLHHLDVQVLADGRHSVPTTLTISNGQETRSVVLPPVADDPGRTGPAILPVDLAPLTGTSFVVTIASTRDVMTVDRHLQQPVVMPVGLAELGVSAPPVRAGPAGLLDTGCRSDLLTLDGQPLPVQITGSWSEAVEGAALPLRPCGDPDSLALGAGEHIVRSAPGTTTGLDVDRVVLASAAGGEPAATGPLLADRTAPTPTATVTETGRTSRKVEVDGGDGPFWLVLGEGLNRGWKATANGRDLGSPRSVDGGMNGWRVDRTDGEAVSVTLTWEPQRFVWAGLAASLAGVVACAVLALARRRPTAVSTMAVSEPPSPRRWRDLASDSALSWPPLALVAGIVAVFTALLLHPIAAIVVAGAMVLAGRQPRLRWLCAGSSLAAMGLTTAFYVSRQWRTRPAEGFGWPSAFRLAHPVALAAVAFLVADVALSLLAARARRAGTPPSEPRVRPDRAEALTPEPFEPS